MSKDTVNPKPLASAPPAPRAPGTAPEWQAPPATLPTRGDLLAAVHEVTANDLVIATTGYTGRELYALDDRANQLYMVGSMGCCVSLALGLALCRPDRRVVALDGDGAALMRMGALSVVGHERPENLVHVVLDNGVHESTGGQSTVSTNVDFAAVAAACGYPNVARADSAAALGALLAETPSVPGPLFVHARMRPGVPKDLPRPTVTPRAVAERLRAYIANGR
jgi:phosphonopyruvate decarboxylase